MKYIATYSCSLRHEARTAYGFELGKDWVEELAIKACGYGAQAECRRPHKPGRERCAVCGSTALWYSIEVDYAEELRE